MSGHFEVVRGLHGNQKYHARYVAGNGRVVWTTEQYGRKRAAMGACVNMAVALADPPEYRLIGEEELVFLYGPGFPARYIQIKHIDERV